MSDTVPLLRVEGLSKTFRMYHLDSMLHAFQNISFDLHEGEFLLLRGHNGAGKSTLLRTLWRSYLPVAGHLWYRSTLGEIDLATAADVDIALLRRQEIGFVTQFLNARPRVAAQDLVAEPLLLAGVNQAEALTLRTRFGWETGAWHGLKALIEAEDVRVAGDYSDGVPPAEPYPVIGDPEYGAAFRTKANRLPEPARSLAAGFPRQALHAAVLGFIHPVSGEPMRFETPPPDDMARLAEALETA